MKFKNVGDVARWRLCLGCGTCVYACTLQKIRLVDVEDDGIRPMAPEDGCAACDACLKACPGINTSSPVGQPAGDGSGTQDDQRWGGCAEVWEGWAADPEIRFKGSSGGLCTALSLFCLEQGLSGGVVHIGASSKTPWKNETFRSTTREELVARTGSRYAPASPGEGLGLIEKAKAPSVFVGKPCDIAGLRMAQRIGKELSEKTALAIGFFCAGTPSTRATLEFFGRMGAEPEQVAEFRYRGRGWPGMARVNFKDENRPPLQATYRESWGFVQRFRPFRCYLCPDLTAESADISVGDPWYREIGEDDPGRSLILLRTETGREIFHSALKKGYVTAEPADPEIIYRSQKNLLGKRQAIWGRLLAMKLLGIPAPRLEGFHLFRNWLDLPLTEKVKSIAGTARRVVQRNYFKPVAFESKDGKWLTKR